MTKQPEEPVNEEKQTYQPPQILVEFELETSAGSRRIIFGFDDGHGNVNPWDLP